MMKLSTLTTLLLLIAATIDLSLARLLSGEGIEDHPNSWCHCDGPSELHCSTNQSAAEAFCECHDHDGEIEVHCQEVDSSCHCDGSEIHCSSGEDVATATCQCHEGTLECIGDEDHHEHEDDHVDDHPNSWCDCDGTSDLQCSTDNVAAESYCECHDHDGEVEVHCQAVDASCHCDGSEIHCSSESDEEVAAATCQCHDGSLECIGDEVFSEDQENEGDKPWAQVIVTCLVVNLVTLAGLFVLATTWVRKLLCPNRTPSTETVCTWRCNIIPMFSAGAVLATAVFLVLPEALHLIQSGFGGGHDHGHGHRLLREQNPESQATWRWGTSILGGLLIPVAMHALFPHHHVGHDHEHGLSHREVDELLRSANDIRDPTDSNKSSSSHDAIDSAIPMVEVNEDEVVADDFLPKDNETTSSQDATAKNDVSDSPMEEAKVIIEQEKSDPEDPLKADLESDKKNLHFRRGSIQQALYYRRDSVQRAMDKADEKFNVSLLLSLTVADLFHQIADGVFIGTAWLLCDKDLAITIAIATVIHCFPHQLADYLLMVNHCGLSEWYALGINFLFGMGTVLGGVIVLAFVPSNVAIGVILAIGGGIFLHVAIADCLGMAEKHQLTKKHKLYGFTAFITGCVPIGLVLLNHEHCDGH